VDKIVGRGTNSKNEVKGFSTGWLLALPSKGRTVCATWRQSAK
jgi:hypothetical protein